MMGVIGINVWSAHKHREKLRYVHRNPVKRELVETPDQWKWSSFRAYAFGETGPVVVMMRSATRPGVDFLDDILAVPVIEVVRGSERPGFLDTSAEWIILEGCGAHSGINRLYQAVLEVPGEAAALGVGEGIAVCVM